MALAVVLAAAAGMIVLSPEAPRVSWLDNGRSFAPDELEALTRALAIKGIDAELDDLGRIGVAPDRLGEALKVLDQQGLARRALTQEFGDPARPSLLADSRERAQVFLSTEAAKLQRALEGIPGILSAIVKLQPGPTRPFADPEPARAGIHLTASRDRVIAPETVERVLNVVTAFTGLEAEDVTIIDAKGDALLRAGDERLAHSMRAEARARGWEAAIAEELARVVEGARVEIRLEEPIGDGTSGKDDEPRTPRWTAVAVVPNGPMSLEHPSDPGAPADEQGDGGRADSMKANVLVWVPASYYLGRHEAFAEGKEPGGQVLDRLVAFTENYIRKIVTFVIPEGSLGDLQILMLPLPTEPVEPSPRVRQALGWPAYWWAPAAVIGAGALLALIAAAGGWLPGRRSSPRSVPASSEASSSNLPPLRDDDAPSSADRVRELVRRDPSAAAAVLRRWVEQGVDA